MEHEEIEAMKWDGKVGGMEGYVGLGCLVGPCRKLCR